ncbi:hypothetical protein SG34_021620 [Thalassomonas viridans]|uniref:Calx-beta domain-containing protein n=1 Tax=Thalassomonas viridans TaxID=137584 RepID=A0AAF0C887_9GAMM|nr:hypothetical protein [Thalassomonas viridans]WDE03945.1 hypothetical protein SG34_021620 [Thalassomonas viridans]
MFKKTLLALALTGAAVGANAATVITTSLPGAAPVSSQGLPATNAYTLFDDANDALPLDGGSVILTLAGADNSGITDGGRLVVNVTGAFFANPASALAVSGGTLDAAQETVVINAGDSSSTQLVFDLAQGTEDWVVVDNDTISIGDVELIVTGDSVTFDSVFTTNTDVEIATTAAAAVEVAAITDQWEAGVVLDLTANPQVSGALDALIDVADNRETFTTGTTDTLTIDANTSGTGATTNDATVTISGNFEGVASVTAATGADAAVTYTINDAMTEATFTYAAGATTDDELLSDQTVITFTLETAADEVAPLDIRDFTVSLDVDYDDAEGSQNDISLLTDAAAGGWDLNGETTTLEYMPFGPNTQMIVQATSTFDEEASVSISYLNETSGQMVTLADIGTVAPNAVTKLGTIISDAIIADSGEESGKTRVVITINAPAGNVSLFTAFKDTNDADRLGVPQT